MITITPEIEKMSKEINMSLDEIAEATGSNVEELSVDNNYIYQIPGADSNSIDDYSRGKVMIYNNYESDQPLVATTRLLSDDEILFRIQEDVVVPSGGSIEVDVKADEVGKQGDIEPSIFEIVALNSTKKEFIYAESYIAMSGGSSSSSLVTEEDILTAKETAKLELIKKAQEELLNDHSKINISNIGIKNIESTTDVEHGDKASSVAVDSTAEIFYISLTADNLKKICKQEFQQIKNENSKITVKKTPKYSFINENGINSVTIQCAGTATIDAKGDLIDKNQLTNKTENQVKQYLENFVSIKEVKVAFSPFWVKTTPFIIENIIIK
ncbi:MAG: hypothetical protein V1898_04195 [Patescibacteria group bacterium]